MSIDRDTTRLVRSWLEEGVTVLPDRVLDSVLDQLPATPQRRSWWPARRVRFMNSSLRLGLAAAVVLAAGLLAVGIIGGPRPSPTPASTASPSPTAMAFPAEGDLVPGSYVLTTVQPLRITFTVSAPGWVKNPAPNAIWTSNSEGRIGFGTVETLYADPCSTFLAPREPAIGPSVDDLASALATMPGLGPATVTDVTFAGRPAKLIEIVATAEQIDCGLDGYALWDEAPLDVGRNRLFILDVDGTRLAIHAVERPGLQTVLRNELQQILDSVQIASP